MNNTTTPSTSPIAPILELFVSIKDPRIDRTKIYSLPMLLFIALCTFLTGGTSYYDMEDFAKNRKDFLDKFFIINSIPSHDTFGRIFALIDKKAFANCLISLVEHIGDITKRNVIAFDGKVCRRAKDALVKAAHIVSAWSSGEKISLGQLKVNKKENEIVAVPLLIDMLGNILSGAVITVDALNSQKNIAKKIISKNANYIFPIKDNHPGLHNDLKLYLDNIADTSDAMYTYTTKGHGRIEERKTWQIINLDWLTQKNEWEGIKSICVVEKNVYFSDGKIESVRQYYISSLDYNPKFITECIRLHWGIENGCHWILDVVMREDWSRARQGDSAANLRALRGICLNFINTFKQKIKSTKSTHRIMREACMSDKKLSDILSI